MSWLFYPLILLLRNIESLEPEKKKMKEGHYTHEYIHYIFIFDGKNAKNLNVLSYR